MESFVIPKSVATINGYAFYSCTKLTIYSLVNSIVDGGGAMKVQILVNGETNVKYHETIELSQPFSRNLEIIKEEE